MIPWPRLSLSLLVAGFPALAADGQIGSDLAAMLRTPGSLQARLRFDHLTSADGLSQDSVFSILQDRHGFMWFGTQAGLNRYDGYRVIQYRHDPRNSNSLAGDFVQNLLEDSRGRIWIDASGLTRFDPETETFTRFPLPQQNSPSGRAMGLQRMIDDRSGFLWLAMSGGRTLYRLDPATGALTGFDIGGTLPQGLEFGVFGMYRDPDGMLWLGSNYGLIRFDPSTAVTTLYPKGAGTPSLVSIRAITRDRAGNFWLATTEDGQNFFDPHGGAYSRRWGVPNREQLAVETNTVLAGADGVIWLGKMNALEVFDPASGARAILRHNPADPHSLSRDEIQSLAADRDGNLWIGTKAGGVNLFSPGTLRFGAWRHNPGDPNSLSDDNVRAMCRDHAGVVWIGTYDGGLDRFDPVSGTFTPFRHDARNPRSLDSDRVYSIYEDRSGDLWVGTVTGINRLDRGTGTFTHFERGPLGGPGIPTYSFLEDSRGVFRFGTGEASASLDRRTGAVTSISRSGGLSMHEDRAGNLWFSAFDSFTRMDTSGNLRRIAFPKTAGTNSPANFQLNFIHEDAQGLLWLATETGLVRFDPKSEAYTSYTTHEGLPDNVVQCIVPDSAGNLWLSTNNGISRFDPRDKSFTNYHESDGLQSEQFNRKSCFVDPGGVMYFGGLHGFNMFDPRRIPVAPRAPYQVVLTELRIGGRTVPVHPGSVLSRPLWEVDAISLSHKDDEFTLEFAALNYRDQARTRYRFKLEGRESQWTEVDSRNRSARYTGLRPAEYRFRVQSSTDGRTWSNQEASLGISIAPPWWMTWWCQAGAMLAGAGLLFGAYKLRVKALRERGVRLQKLVDERTAELVEARDQAEHANRAKSAFLANMSHELRTPLNAILGFSNILREHSASEDQRRDLDIINRSGEHLLTMINDVLDLAKIESGRPVLEIAPCDLKGVMQDVADMMRVRAAEKHLELVLVESADVPRYVRTDAARLREVLINLVGNAIKFTERGSIAVRLAVRRDDQPAGKGAQVLLRVEIEDTGIGIAIEDQERIFKPFEQVVKGQYQKGTGLGLAITRQVLELMGGRIEVESSPGRGSCFRVELPVERAQESEAKPAPGRERILGLDAGQPEYRVLVVEDEQENSMVLERLLREAGFQVRLAGNGRLGVEAFREWRPQFIWMDLRMPVMDGMEAVRVIRHLEGGREVKVAALTASGYDSRRSDVMAAGFDDYLRKPYRPDEIFQCMERHLGVRYRRAEAEPPLPGRPAEELCPEAIDALPSWLRAELRAAVVALDPERISRAIQKVSEHDAALGSTLTRYAKGYAYTTIFLAVEGGSSEGSPNGCPERFAADTSL